MNRLRELVDEYLKTLDQERQLLQRMREVPRELDEVEKRIRRVEVHGKTVSDDDLDERYKLLAELHELMGQHEKLLEEQACLRGKIALEENHEKQRRLIEGQARDDLDVVQRVLDLWPWNVPHV